MTVHTLTKTLQDPDGTQRFKIAEFNTRSINETHVQVHIEEWVTRPGQAPVRKLEVDDCPYLTRDARQQYRICQMSGYQPESKHAAELRRRFEIPVALIRHDNQGRQARGGINND